MNELEYQVRKIKQGVEPTRPESRGIMDHLTELIMQVCNCTLCYENKPCEKVLRVAGEIRKRLGLLCPECDSEVLPSQYCMMGHWCGDRQ